LLLLLRLLKLLAAIEVATIIIIPVTILGLALLIK